MLNKTIVTIIALTVLAMGNPQQPPTKGLEGLSTGDKVVAQGQPKGTIRKRRVMNNLLKGYLGFRQLALSGLGVLERTRDLAFAVNRYHNIAMSIGTAAVRAYNAAEELEEFFIWEKKKSFWARAKDRITGIADAIIYLEEQVLQPADYALIDGPKELKNQKKAIDSLRHQFVLQGANFGSSFEAAFVGPVKRSIIYERVQARRKLLKENATDSAAAPSDSTFGPAQQAQVAVATADKIVASADAKQAELDNNAMLAAATIEAFESESEEPSELSLAMQNRALQRNTLLQEYQKHSNMRDACDVAAMLLLARIRSHESVIAQVEMSRTDAAILSKEKK